MTPVVDDVPPREPPAGFEDFWTTTLAALDAVKPEEADAPLHGVDDDLDVVSLEYTSLGGARIGGYLARSPEPGPRPLVIHGHGYLSSGGAIRAGWVRAGADVCGIDIRGYGRSARALTARDPAGYLLTSSHAPEHSVLRGAVCDHLRGVEIARTLCAATPSRVILQGTSLAGGLATIVQALRPHADLLVLEVPSLAWNAERMRLARSGSGLEVRRYLEADPERAKEITRTLSFFDALHFAGRVRSPALVGVGERDDVVPARTVEALFERLGGPRELLRYPVSHSSSPEERRWSDFEERWLRLARSGVPQGFGEPEGQSDGSGASARESSLS